MRPIRPLLVLAALAAFRPVAGRAQTDDEPGRPAAPKVTCPPPESAPLEVMYYAYRYVEPLGWGCYPVYAPAHGASPAEPRELEPLLDDVSSRFSFYGAGHSETYLGGLSMVLDSTLIGLDAAIEAIADEKVTGPIHGDHASDPAAWGSAHLTWSVVSASWIRIRLLTGGSMLVLPKTNFTVGQAWAGQTLYGLDAGVSATIRLGGPIDAEGWARLTPSPVRIADAYAGVALHGGPIGVLGGWRRIEVHGDGVKAPVLSLRGPQAGLLVHF